MNTNRVSDELRPVLRAALLGAFDEKRPDNIFNERHFEEDLSVYRYGNDRHRILCGAMMLHEKKRQLHSNGELYDFPLHGFLPEETARKLRESGVTSLHALCAVQEEKLLEVARSVGEWILPSTLRLRRLMSAPLVEPLQRKLTSTFVPVFEEV